MLNQFKTTLRENNYLQISNRSQNITNQHAPNIKKPLQQIIPVCLQGTNHENEIPQEIDEQISVYKSFIDEFYTVRSNFHGTPNKIQKKKIFDTLQTSISNQISPQSKKECETQKMSIPNNQEIIAIKPNLLIPHSFLKDQTSKIACQELKIYKQECLKNKKNTNIIIFHNQKLLITLKVIDIKNGNIDIQFIIQNISQFQIQYIDLLWICNSNLKLSKQDEKIINLDPQFCHIINFNIEIIAIPFSLINLSIEFNNQYFSLFLPITILNFLEITQSNNQRSKKQYYFNEQIILQKNQYEQQLNQIIECNLGHNMLDLSVQTKENNIIFNCSCDKQQINWQILNTLYFLYDQ